MFSMISNHVDKVFTELFKTLARMIQNTENGRSKMDLLFPLPCVVHSHLALRIHVWEYRLEFSGSLPLKESCFFLKRVWPLNLNVYLDQTRNMTNFEIDFGICVFYM